MCLIVTAFMDDGLDAKLLESREGYARLLMRDIWQRKAEFFVGLFLSILTGAATSWLQYREGMLEQRHVWDAVVTTAVPVLGLVALFAVVEVVRAAILVHRQQAQLIAEQQQQIEAATRADHVTPTACVEVGYTSRIQTYVCGADEEEYDEFEEYLTFRNVGGEVVRRLTVEPFAILGEEFRVPIVPTLVPGDPPIERRINLEPLRNANVKLKAFNRVPVGVPMTIRYHGALDAERRERHAIVNERGKIRVEPYIGDQVSEFRDASAPVANEGDTAKTR